MRGRQVAEVRAVRWWWLVVVALVTSTVVGVSGISPAAGLTTGDCATPRDPFGDVLGQLPVANDDGGTIVNDGATSWRYQTTWFAPLVVSAPGVLENDTIASSGELRALLVTPTQFGTVSLSENGSWTYVPDPLKRFSEAGTTVTDSFTYLALDSSNNWCSALPATVTFRVTPDANPPVANPTASTASGPIAPGAWANEPITVDWNWVDDSPALCEFSSTSSIEGVEVLTTSCIDAFGNVGSASYETKTDFTQPQSSPTLDPPATAAGWSKAPVTVEWNWTDGTGSGPSASCPASSVVSEESSSPIGTFVTAGCADLAGNTAFASAAVKVDGTAPTAAPTVSPTSGVSNSAVTVTWNWTDGSGSGIDPERCAPTSTATTEAQFLVLQGTCQDQVGNAGSAIRVVTIDRTAPSSSATFSSEPNAAGWWRTAPVTVSWNWLELIGSGIDPASCSPSSTAVSEGVSLVTSTCTDRAGNTGFASRLIRIDQTPPAASPTVSPIPSQGWSKGPVTIDWNWSDNEGFGSGIDPTACPATSNASTSGTITATCTDVAGNTATASQVVRIDSTAPTAAPVLSSAGWSSSDVTVVWNWSDTGGSGLDPNVCPSASVSSGEGVITLTSTCIDVAGNRQTATAVARVDKTAPSIAPTITPNPVLLGGTAQAAANATDSGSGIATQSCQPVLTATLGSKSLECSATDNVGRTTVEAVPYVVGVAVRWDKQPSTIRSKPGSTIKASVRLIGANGRPIPASLSRTLPNCTVQFALGGQSPVCAVYDDSTGSFGAKISSTGTLTSGSTILLTATAQSAGTVLGTTSTPLIVRK